MPATAALAPISTAAWRITSWSARTPSPTRAAVTNRGSQVVVAGLGGGVLPFEALSVSALSPEVSLRRVSAGSRPELRQVLDLGRAGALHTRTVTFPLEEAGAAIDAVDAGSV